MKREGFIKGTKSVGVYGLISVRDGSFPHNRTVWKTADEAWAALKAYNVHSKVVTFLPGIKWEDCIEMTGKPWRYLKNGFPTGPINEINDEPM